MSHQVGIYRFVDDILNIQTWA